MTTQAMQPGQIVSSGDIEPAKVEEMLNALSAALRSYRLYEGNNPMLDRFVAAFQQKMGALWADTSSLTLEVDEHRLLYEGTEVYPKGADTGGQDIAFLFHKDGIREITFLPGFEEDDEAIRFLGVLGRIPAVRQEEDDLITLLWQENFGHFRYTAVESGAEGYDFPQSVTDKKEISPINATQVRQDEPDPQRQGLSTEDFQETLYFLDDAELRKLRDEVQRESQRDLWRDVVNALLDRLEDGDPARQQRIINIMGELLPSALASAQFERCAQLLGDVVQLAGQGTVLAPAAMKDMRGLFDQLGSPETVMQLADILEEMPDRLSEDAVLKLLSYFPPGSIPSLMRAAERVEQPSAKRAFEVCIQRLAESNREEIVGLLRTEDPAVLTGALRWIGRLQIGAAVSEITRFLRHASAEVRIAAIDALVSIRAAAAATGIVPLLQDQSREVRIAAVRALGALSFTAARGQLEQMLNSKPLRDADRLEKLAVFESYGKLAGGDGVAVLDKILNAKSWLGKGESSEFRACAALGLAKIRHPSARQALDKAANDPDPVVRTAVTRAIRGESA